MKAHPPRTLQWGYAQNPMVVLGGGGVLMSEVPHYVEDPYLAEESTNPQDHSREESANPQDQHRDLDRPGLVQGPKGWRFLMREIQGCLGHVKRALKNARSLFYFHQETQGQRPPFLA